MHPEAAALRHRAKPRRRALPGASLGTRIHHPFGPQLARAVPPDSPTVPLTRARF